MKFRSKTFGGLAIAVASIIALGACSSSSSSSSSSASGTPVSGGTATFAELPATTPNYIFPFTSSAYISVSNLNLFQYMLYRPLYWFGTGNQPTVNTTKSLASLPVWSSDGKTVTITLKNFKWSNGQPVTAQNIAFWLNMEQAVGDVDYGAYTGFPNTVVSSMKVASPTTLVLTLNKAYNQQWFLYNELAQVTPMPEAWDATASGPSHCSTTVSDCTAVYKYLDAQSRNLSGYVSSPLWAIVDGPWKLSAFNADGNLTMVPNKSYSGSDKPKLAEFQELPFTTDAAEYDVLRAPSSSSKIDVGYIPTEDLPAKPADAAVGTNPLPGYTLGPWNSWGISYYTVNEQSTDQRPRRDLQAAVLPAGAGLPDERGGGAAGPAEGLRQPDHRASGERTGDPVAVLPGKEQRVPVQSNQGQEPAEQPRLERDPGRDDHVFQREPVRLGDQRGYRAELHLRLRDRAGVDPGRADPAAVERGGGGHQAEPQARAVQHGGRGVCGQLRGGQDPVQLGHGRLGPGLVVLPGHPADRGDAVHVRRDRQLRRVLRQDQRLADRPDAGQQQQLYMYTWQNYLQTQLPVEWQPNAPYQVTEVVSNLHGVLPQPSTLLLDPEDWYYTS